ncbi:hypothetical protein HMH01_16845, partial [Halovulum dunhuangense]|nr:hypothetical protein [Halovulum dunhuangense]
IEFTPNGDDEYVLTTDVSDLQVKAADGVDTAEITLTVFRNGERVTTGGLVFWAATSMGTLRQGSPGAEAPMRDNNDGSYTALLTSTSAGLATIVVSRDDVGGEVIGQTQVTFGMAATDDLVEETQDQIATFMLARTNNLVSNQPDIARFLIDNDCGNFSAQATEDSGSLNGCFSQNNVWTEISSSWSDGEAYTLFTVGAHRFVSPNMLVGAMLQVDSAESGSADVSGTGWMAGPYFVAKTPEQPLYFEGRVLYGQTSNQISPLGFYTDDFETDRWLVQLGVTGQYSVRDISLLPAVKFTYAEDRQQTYTDSLDNVIPGQTVSLMQLNAGMDFGIPLPSQSGSLELVAGVSGIYSATDGAAREPAFENLRGRTHLNVIYGTAAGTNLRVGAHYDGLGSDFESYGASLNLEVKF